MNITNTIYRTLKLIDTGVTDLLSSDNPSRAFLKSIRLTLKSLHPDAGGSADEFDKLHKLYESVLSFKKKTSDADTYIADALRIISERGDISNKSVEADTDLPNVDIKPDRTKYAYVNISELVLHFNKLAYCQVEENRSLLTDMVKTQIYVVAIEPDESTGCSTTSQVCIDKLMPHRYDGKYETYIALELARGTILMLHIPGFEKTVEYTVDTSGGLVVSFDENLVKLDVKLQISVI